MSIKAGVLGGTGYVGTQLVSILSSHPEVDLKWITSEKFKNKQFYDAFPYLRGMVNVDCNSISKLDELDRVDVAFSCLPELMSVYFIERLIAKGMRVIDLSPDLRIKNPEHGFEKLTESAVYGLSEINRVKIKDSRLVANPGCFTTSVLLPLVPLFKNNMFYGGLIIIDVKAPISGAGRAPRVEYHFPESNQNIVSDGNDGYFQKLETVEYLKRNYDYDKRLLFTVHRISVSRGILTSIYMKLDPKVSLEELMRVVCNHYLEEKFIRVHENSSSVGVKNVLYSNFCDIGFNLQDDFLIIESALDNLMKGASGQAVQNMNIMFGLDEIMGLEAVPVYP